VDKALNYVFSKDRDFQDFLKTPQASRSPPHCVSVEVQAGTVRTRRRSR
jgi:hypothetical protein